MLAKGISRGNQMFKPKFAGHKYRDEIITHFTKGTAIPVIQAWLKSLGPEYVLAGDTLRRHKRHYMENKEVARETARVKKEMGNTGNQIEDFLLETITQCRLKKRSPHVSGKDFQYYDQQMQSAIKLLQDIRVSGEDSMDIQDVFAKLTQDIVNDKGRDTTGTDNKVSGNLHKA